MRLQGLLAPRLRDRGRRPPRQAMGIQRHLLRPSRRML
jgi:hypothetical protein